MPYRARILTTLAGVPGFYSRQTGFGNERWTVAGWSGLLIPYRLFGGAITSLQIRGDNGDYYYLSSNPEKYGRGTKVYRTAHLACPPGVTLGGTGPTGPTGPQGPAGASGQPGATGATVVVSGQPQVKDLLPKRKKKRGKA